MVGCGGRFIVKSTGFNNSHEQLQIVLFKNIGQMKCFCESFHAKGLESHSYFYKGEVTYATLKVY